MSAIEEKSSIDEGKTRIIQDESSKNPIIITEGNVSLDSNRNTETSSVISENMPQSAAIEESGDDKVNILQDNLKLDKLEAELTETPIDFINTKAGEGSGDYTAKAKVSRKDDKEIADVHTEIDAKISKTRVTAEKDESDDTFLEKCDEIVSKTADDPDEIEDEDMELRWDDDDASNQAMGDGIRNAEAKNDDIPSEDHLLEDTSDVLTKDMTEMPSDGDPKVSESNPDSDVLKVNSEENILTRDNNFKEIETTNDSEISPKLDIPTDKSEDDKSLEDELLGENNLNTEAINSPEMDFPAEGSMDRDDEKNLGDELLGENNLNTEAINSPEMDFPAEGSINQDDEKRLGDELLWENDLNTEAINSPDVDFPTEGTMDRNDDKSLGDELLGENDLNTEAINSPDMEFPVEESIDRDDINVLEEKLLEESEIVTEAAVIDQAKEILEEKSMDEPIKKTESAKDNLLKEVTTDEQAKEDPVDIIQDQLLAEPENNTEMESAKLKVKSFTDVILNKDNAGIMSEENLLEEPDCKGQSSLILSEKGIEFSKIVPEKQGPVNKEDNDDVLLEEKLLQETETAEAIPESDVTMDVDDEEEGELLKDDECQEDSCTPMDVDKTDTSIEDQANIEDKIIDQTMNQSEVAKKGTAFPIDDQTNIKKVDDTKDELKNMDQSYDQSKIIEEDIDQPIKDTTKAVDVIKDTPIENELKINEKIVDQSEKQTIDEQFDDQTKMGDSNKDPLILESQTKDQSIKIPVQTDALTVCNTPDILVEDLKKTIPENEIKSKTDPEEPTADTENINKNTDLDKPEKSKVTINPDTSLDKNEEVDEISPNNSSIFLEDSCPIKTDHGLHKPDVMLEIPTQELIDMDDTDLSMNLDHSEMIDSLNYIDKNVEDNIVHEKTIDKTVIDDVIVSDDIVTVGATVSEKSVDNTIADDEIVKQKPVDQKAIVTETIADDKIVTDDDTVKQKSVVQEAIVTESTVSEVLTESNLVESDKKDDDAVVQSTVEENMEKMFADDVPEVAKEIPDCIASTSQVQVPTEHPSTSITRMTPDTSDEVPEIDDSLGLLAESAGRMMEDDEEPDDDFDGDDDDDFDNDESSNQISAEQSEDSNPAALESEPVTEQEDKELETPDPKDEEFPFMMCDSTSQDKAEKMDVEEEYGTVQLEAEIVNEMNEEAKSAVDALLNADNPADEQAENQQETTEQMDIETVKLSDTSDNEVDVEPTKIQPSVAESSKESEEKQKSSPAKSPNKSNISPTQSPSKLSQSPSKKSPSKMKNLAITTQEASSVVNIVDLEETSSSEDDIQEVQKQPETTEDDKSPSPESAVTNVNIPTGIDIMCTSGGNTSEITTKDNLSQVVISGVPKPPPHKPARLNTSEVTIKTASNTEPLIIPETKINEQNQTQSKPKLSLEIFSLDSDEDENAAKEKSTPTSPDKMTALELDKARETSKCINYCCTSDNKVPYKVAEASVVAYYDAGRKRRSVVCQPCADVVAARTKNLIQGIKELTPLLDLDMGKLSQDLVEISDSESEDEEMSPEEPKESIGEKGAKFIEDNLAKYLNDTWKKYEMDVRLTETQIMLDDEIDKLEKDSKEIDAMLNECQVATDKLRCELYATFECRRQQQPSLVICDTPDSKYIGLEEKINPPAVAESIIETRQAKRRLSSTSETPAKRPAIPLGYAPLDAGDAKEKAAIPGPDIKLDEDKDISVVKLSAEAAPADLPPPGEISRPPLRVGMPVYAMKNAFGPWLKGRVVEIQAKNTSGNNPFSVCLVKFDHKVKTNGKVLPARCIAYSEPADVRMTIGTRLIALFKDSNKRESYYSGVVAEIPNPVNNYRYLVFFDDGYAQYVQHQFTRLVCESSPLVWEEVHPFSREFVREYLLAYPERPMVRLHEGQHLKTEWNGKWWSSRVTRVDASLAQVMFVGDGRREWVYRGSTRLAPLYLELRAAGRTRGRPMPRSKAQPRFNMPYVEYTRSDEQESSKQVDAQAQQQQQQQQQQIQNEEIRRQRSVAKKSTSAPAHAPPAPPAHAPPAHADPVTSRVVYYTPKNAVKPLKMAPHRCGPRCKRSDVLSLKELRTYNPLAKPLLSGWERQIVRFKGHKEVMYRAPCGRRLRNMRELHHYLRSIDSDLPVDLFDFHYSTHCLAEFVLNKCLVGKKDLSHGKENVPVPCVNYYDDSLPEFCSYNTERTPTAGVPLNLEPEFLCGCDCTDDCQDKSKCACWKMTLEGARTVGLRGPNVGYVYKRLPEPLPSGIYECNSRCKCKHTCLNRVAQHPLQLKLQVFKTPNRGWGIRALNDVPKGSFLCVYAGNLLTDATANLDGLNEGDEYLAELDYIEVVEQMKEGYEEDIPEADKKLDKKETKDDDESEEEEPSSSEEEEKADKNDKEDDDFRPGYIGLGVTEFSKRLRKREKSKKDKEKSATDEKEKEKDMTKEGNGEEDCITISDDEEVREPSRFMAQTNMGANEYISKYKSVRTLFGKDEACYIMDAKVQGNIGRYLNHSCCPNVFVQNVFVDTHDPRFPWVAFFALSHIKAGTELTWNYNYDVGSVPGKILYCYCGAPNCRGRLL